MSRRDAVYETFLIYGLFSSNVIINKTSRVLVLQSATDSYMLGVVVKVCTRVCRVSRNIEVKYDPAKRPRLLPKCSLSAGDTYIVEITSS